MKLEKIKLSGFKSFVDPTTIPIKGNLTAIVGPNGCGKSNIIDAVRWVMGESSAKHLRGGSMADVIFNGSSGRKPVSSASVELIFDNSEGKLGGEYAQYDSIAIRRQISRDGLSSYMLNGARCRRKDITDLFLGTGLGSRSYAIIEQGTISRMVEAKPEELRVHIEEAAGISKYKERRGETETRMKQTRENLERLDDVRDEVDKQCKHLQKQAEKAEKYTELKQQERQFRLELLAMRWNIYYQAATQLDTQLQAVATEHNRLFVLRRSLESSLENQRNEHKTQQQQFNHIQEAYYAAVTEVSTLQQTIKHNETSHQETLAEISRSQQQQAHATEQLAADRDALENIAHDLMAAEQALLIAKATQEEALHIQQDAQQKRSVWQAQWETYRTESATYKAQIELHRVKISQLDNQNRQLQNRLDKLHNERDDLYRQSSQNDLDALQDSIEQLTEDREILHSQLASLLQKIREQRELTKQLHNQLHGQRSESHSVQGKVTSLELLQQHAMGKDNQPMGAWLASVKLEQHQRLAEFLDVESGWELAVETVLGSYLEAICVDNAEAVIANLSSLANESLTLFETHCSLTSDTPAQIQLRDKISSPWNLSALLSGVYCATNHNEARQLSTQLKTYESVITADGTWFGPGWLKIIRAKDSKTGILQREKQLRTLKHRQETLNNDIASCEAQLDNTESALKTAELNREASQQQHNNLNTALSFKSAEFSAATTKAEQQQGRLKQIQHELDDINQELSENAEMIAESQLLHDEAEQIMAEQDEKRQHLEALSQTLQAQQYSTEHIVNETQQQFYSIKAQIEALRSAESLTQKQIERLQLQQQHSTQHISQLQQKSQQTNTPRDAEKQQLAQRLIDKNKLESQLAQQRTLQADSETHIANLATEQTQTEKALEKQKEKLDHLRFELQENKVRQQTVNEQLKEIDADIEQVLSTLPAQAEESTWKRKVDELSTHIDRLGTINLTAIEDYKTHSERMCFLNEQHADLVEALHTLDQAISKIDKESRLRFKETFDKINTGLQEKFPKLFGGGQAYLELTDQNILESGVTIIARPPGKRNSSIHLLSGGEKALTAVALVFSIFELNPAPFCLLDEVDAPLDDANVGRFSKMVEEMSASVQFLYISHNKVTMEIAKQLAGVTMKEPGVSRMVAVDIEEAVSLAEI
ncbi:chromosome segregation protein SMC [Crenothrix polyspora]|uniref:Chromosome partition protein Smc n=1 Tax=Crenothrix polyspora TaxID=360316 RepID=A0A1R4H7N4_9GAMM|nr:chromosome segregation protein SMC [Crenothrix polyspora]SJM91860.1 Chromosome partition protein Smc [Crenothrix polyspora]